MQRDMDLVRSILMELADSENPLDAGVFVDDTRDYQFIAYHIDIMEQAGLLKATIKHGWNKTYMATSADALTWEGQDYLASVKSDKLWSHVKLTIAKQFGDVGFSTIKALAEKIALSMIDRTL